MQSGKESRLKKNEIRGNSESCGRGLKYLWVGFFVVWLLVEAIHGFNAIDVYYFASALVFANGLGAVFSWFTSRQIGFHAHPRREGDEVLPVMARRILPAHENTHRVPAQVLPGGAMTALLRVCCYLSPRLAPTPRLVSVR